MAAVIRYFLLLAGCSMLFLAVLGWLLFSHHDSTRRLESMGFGLLDPGREDMLAALLRVHQLDQYLRASARADPGSAVPATIRIEAALNAIDQHLGDAAQRAEQFRYQGAYGLPGRAAAELARLRDRLAVSPRVDAPAARALYQELDLLRSTLLQLDRVYELAQREHRRELLRATASATRSVMVAVGLLLLVSAPLLALLILQLRTALRREMRSRRELAEANSDLHALAHFDGLTGLGNRHLFRSRLSQAVAEARRSGKPAALLYVDLDHFKRINDSLGHDVGDQVLAQLGRRLQDAVRESDTVARIGGDEFTVILSDLADADSAGVMAEKLLARIREPLVIGSRELVLSASVGITMLPGDGDDPTTLMRNADLALYKTKETGRRGFHFYHEQMNRRVVAHMRMEAEMRKALRDEAFELHYQPQVVLADGRVDGVEALLRWTRGDGGSIEPAEFIAVAETTGLMPELGAWVLRRACADVALMNRRRGPALGLSVNLSVRQLHDRDLVARVSQALADSGLAPGLLELEITETTLVESMEATAGTLRTLRELGVRIAIDDFGVGYSSLAYLRRLPVDRLKIDRAFLRDIESDGADRSLVATIVAMARSLSLRVVAEGVETEGQLQQVLALGCESAQGFLLCKPVPLGRLSPMQVQQDFNNLGLARPGGLRVADS